MVATFANSTPTPSAWFWNEFVHPHPQSHTHTHAQRVWKNTLQNLQCFLLIANKNDKGLLDTTRYNSYNYHITLANICDEDPL